MVKVKVKVSVKVKLNLRKGKGKGKSKGKGKGKGKVKGEGKGKVIVNVKARVKLMERVRVKVKLMVKLWVRWSKGNYNFFKLQSSATLKKMTDNALSSIFPNLTLNLSVILCNYFCFTVFPMCRPYWSCRFIGCSFICNILPRNFCEYHPTLA